MSRGRAQVFEVVMARGRKVRVRSDASLVVEGGGFRPAAPAGLTAGAAVEWARLIPHLADLAALAALDEDALRQYCEAVALYRQAVAELRGQPLTLTTPNGAMQVHPLLKVRSQAEATMSKLSERFGLDPASRKRLAMATAATAADPMVEFLARGRSDRQPPFEAE